MSFPVTYYCPHCGVLAEVRREGYLDDKSVTPYPLGGWEYARPTVVFGETSDDGVTNGRGDVTDEGDESPGQADGDATDGRDDATDNRNDTTDDRDDSRESADEDPTGVRFVCGESDGVTWRATPAVPDDVDRSALPDDVASRLDADAESGAVGCGEPFYLSFVRFENGREATADAAGGERVRLAETRGLSGPSGPDGPGGPDRFY